MVRTGTVIWYISLCIVCCYYDGVFTTGNEHPHTVGVFCSAEDTVAQSHKNAAYSLGRLLGLNGFKLVTGGSNKGLMRHVNDGYVSTGSQEVYAIVPEILQTYDIVHWGIWNENVIWTDTLHQRLAQFQAQCDCMIILPGGFGTLHELIDFLTHYQFGYITPDIIILNHEGFWSPLLQQFEAMVASNALEAALLRIIHVADTPQSCIQHLMRTRMTSHVYVPSCHHHEA
mgnify:CR=1 FL=1